jgi:hypothetical protein
MATIEQADKDVIKANPGPRPPRRPTAQAAVEAREYIVFGRVHTDDSHDAWAELGRATTATRDDALDKIVDGLPADEQAGTFAVVAARNFIVVTPKVETVVKRSWQ